MASTFYCTTKYLEDTGKAKVDGSRMTMRLCNPLWGGLLALGLVGLGVVALTVSLIHYASLANSKACKDGLALQAECHNTTHQLNRQLTQAQEGFRAAEDRAVSCNQTVVRLEASLEATQSQAREQQELIEELKGKVQKLNQSLQEMYAEVEQLRREKPSSNSAATPGAAFILIVVLGLAARRVLHF